MPDRSVASARNVFQGTVTAIHMGAINAEVNLQLRGGTTLVGVVNLGALQSLGLQVGQPALALVKAPWVMLMTRAAGEPTGQLSARNQLQGVVRQLTPGGVNAEVTLALTGGDEVHAVVTQDAVRRLGLAIGQPATAIIKASDVLLATPS